MDAMVPIDDTQLRNVICHTLQGHVHSSVCVDLKDMCSSRDLGKSCSPLTAL